MPEVKQRFCFGVKPALARRAHAGEMSGTGHGV